MVLNPEALEKAQKEIETVVGTARLPEFSDRESLPYIECVMNEVLRWGAPVPLGTYRREVAFIHGCAEHLARLGPFEKNRATS